MIRTLAYSHAEYEVYITVLNSWVLYIEVSASLSLLTFTNSHPIAFRHISYTSFRLIAYLSSTSLQAPLSLIAFRLISSIAFRHLLYSLQAPCSSVIQPSGSVIANECTSIAFRLLSSSFQAHHLPSDSSTSLQAHLFQTNTIVFLF